MIDVLAGVRARWAARRARQRKINDVYARYDAQLPRTLDDQDRPVQPAPQIPQQQRRA